MVFALMIVLMDIHGKLYGAKHTVIPDKGTENVVMQNLQCLLCRNGTELLIVVSLSYTGHDYTAYMNCMHLAVRERPSNLITH